MRRALLARLAFLASRSSGNLFIGLLFCFAAFIGFEATTIYSEEARNPRHSIPSTTSAVLLRSRSARPWRRKA